MSVGTLEEIIDDNHAIVSTSVGSEHYVSILSFVDKDMLEPGCTVLLNHKVCLQRCSVGNVPFIARILKVHLNHWGVMLANWCEHSLFPMFLGWFPNAQ